MGGKILYGALLSLLLAYSAWQWSGFELPVMKHAVLPPALPTALPLSTGQLETILAHNLWDKDRGEGQKKNTALSDKASSKLTLWSLKGIAYQQMHEPVVMLASGAVVKAYREGDSLPDGALLVRIMAGSIIIQKNGKEQYVYLFKEK